MLITGFKYQNKIILSLIINQVPTNQVVFFLLNQFIEKPDFKLFSGIPFIISKKYNPKNLLKKDQPNTLYNHLIKQMPKLLIFSFQNNTTKISYEKDGQLLSLKELKQNIAKKSGVNVDQIILHEHEEPDNVINSSKELTNLIKGFEEKSAKPRIGVKKIDTVPKKEQEAKNKQKQEKKDSTMEISQDKVYSQEEEKSEKKIVSLPNSSQSYSILEEKVIENCSRCSLPFTPEEKVYILINEEGFVLCSNCDKKNTKYPSYGISLAEFKKKHLNYGITSIFILSKKKSMDYFESLEEESIEKLQEIKNKIKALADKVFDWNEPQSEEEKVKLKKEIKEFVFKNKNRTEKELFQLYKRRLN